MPTSAPDVGVRLEVAVAALRERRARTALLFDFDGTLSPTVPEPTAARPAPGVVELLTTLAEGYGTVAIISGRPVEFLREHLPEGIALSGQYGAEMRHPDGSVTVAVDPTWAEAIDSAVADLRASAGRGEVPDGVVVEPKGLTLTVHHRANPAAEDWVRERTADIGARTGLVVHGAKASVELRPPSTADKGTVVEELSSSAEAVLYVGDDVGDLPALRAVSSRPGGRLGVAAVVDGPELPAEVRAVADLLLTGVEGPGGVVDLLRRLAEP